MNTLRLFHRYQEQLARESSSAFLFAQRPALSFAPTQQECPDCQAPLQAYKTQRKTLHTLDLGGFTARETLLHCGHCPNDAIYATDELSQLVPAGCTFGYDPFDSVLARVRTGRVDRALLMNQFVRDASG